MRVLLKSFWPLLVITVAQSAMLSGYVLADVSPPPNVIDLWGKVFGTWVIIGIQNDARLRRKTPCYDFGFLMSVMAMVSIPWYFCSSRGVLKGLFLIVLLVLLAMLPELVLQIVWEARYG